MRALYPETPPWGFYLAMGIYDLKQTVQGKASWTAQDIAIVMGSVVAVIAALKGTGAV
jgi:hypothetical protein